MTLNAAPAWTNQKLKLVVSSFYSCLYKMDPFFFIQEKFFFLFFIVKLKNPKMPPNVIISPAVATALNTPAPLNTKDDKAFSWEEVYYYVCK